MRIVVTSFKGAPLAESIQSEFAAPGGTIGREVGNQLVLPDPERHISRIHARVVVEAGAYFVEDLGSNPTAVNGVPIGRGARAPLKAGDRISIGEYELRAESSAPAAYVPPAQAQSGSDPLGLFGGAPVADPFASLNRSPTLNAAPADDPFGVFSQAAAAPPPQPTPAAASFDPFAPTPRPVAPPPAMAAPLAPEADIDALFGMSPAAANADPFAGTSLSGHAARVDVSPAHNEDPLALFGGATPAPMADPVRDDAPVLAENFGLPRPLADAFPPAAPAPAAPGATPVTAPEPLRQAPAAQDPAGQTPNIVLSWSPDAPRQEPVPPSELRPVAPLPPTEINMVRPGVDVLRPRPAPQPGEGFDPGALDMLLQASPQAVTPATPAADVPDGTVSPAPAAPTADAVASDARLLEAFQRGLGMQIFSQGGLTPERMEQLGVVVRECVAGTVGLLQARAMTKREFRADVTMIVSKANNPLKFAPDLEFALSQLLEPKGKGFLAAEPAMRDAYLDLRSHQFGFLAGMRAAIGGLIERFKPDVLEQRISRGGFLSSVLPGARKARLWDLYEERYAEISGEARDDFDALFGREFLKAYEEQIERLRDEAEAK